jgi:hypothetical protein
MTKNSFYVRIDTSLEANHGTSASPFIDTGLVADHGVFCTHTLLIPALWPIMGLLPENLLIQALWPITGLLPDFLSIQALWPIVALLAITSGFCLAI